MKLLILSTFLFCYIAGSGQTRQVKTDTIKFEAHVYLFVGWVANDGVAGSSDCEYEVFPTLRQLKRDVAKFNNKDSSHIAITSLYVFPSKKQYLYFFKN